MSRILITGATGLCGRALCLRLLEKSHEVFAVVKDLEAPLPMGVSPVIIDLSKHWEIELLPLKIDMIVHLAQSPHFRDFPERALDIFKVNVESTARLLDYGKRIGIEKFIYTSSGGIYGNGSHAFQENAPVIPTSKLGHYLGTKSCCEILINSYASVFDVVILRPFFVYGPGQNQSMLMPRLYRNVSSNDSILLDSSCGIRINPVHVNDASIAIMNACKLVNSTVINIAGPEVLSIREICDLFGSYLGKRPIYEKVSGDSRDLIGDISLMKELLHVPTIRLRDVLEEFAPNTDHTQN